MNEFQPGDFVRLKRGSPLMVVQAVKEGFAECAWLSQDRGSPRHGAFAVTMLERAEAAPPGAYRVFSE